MIKTPKLVKLMYPQLLWKLEIEENKVFLTFDDGPVPGVTDFVLDELDKYGAKGTFFCVGDNILKHPYVFQKILAAGHRVGNHTFNHQNGWKTADAQYFENIRLCDEVMSHHIREKKDKLFRPPYGRIKKSQIKEVAGQYRIVMWDVLTKDYDGSKSVYNCLQKSIAATEPGSIVVFHDRYKNEERLREMLPKYLKHFSDAGYEFAVL